MFDVPFSVDHLSALVDAGVVQEIVLRTSELEYRDVFARLDAQTDDGPDLIWANQAYIDGLAAGWQCVYRIGREFYAEYDTGRDDHPAHLERI